jgi:chromate reductase
MALRAAQKLAPEGMQIEIADIRGLPGFSEDDEQTPPQRVAELKKQIMAADAILFVTPEYNYSVPGVLKNAIDWCSRPYGKNAWSGKPTAIMGASISKIGSARAQYHLRQSLVFLNMPVVIQPEVMIIEAQNQFGADGDLRNDDTKKLIRQLLDALVVLTNKMTPEKSRAR